MIWDLCKKQVIIDPMGGPISIRIEAIMAAMEILGIEEKEECLSKVLIFAEELFQKDE